jgi:tRNA 2-selenouridine synthase
MAMDGRHVSLALSLMQHHYDPAYERARARSIAPICRLQASTLDADNINDVAERVMRAAEGLAADA